MWFFEGFCRLLKPKYCALIDVGTIPHKNGLLNYYKALESDNSIGGVSGYMGLYFDEDGIYIIYINILFIFYSYLLQLMKQEKKKLMKYMINFGKITINHKNHYQKLLDEKE